MNTPAQTVFLHGQDIWSYEANGVLLIDSNTMDLSTTPCVQDLPVERRQIMCQEAVTTPIIQVERKRGPDGKVISHSQPYQSLLEQGELALERIQYGVGNSALLGKIKPLPGVSNGFILYTSYHTGKKGVWSPESFAKALTEYCMIASLTKTSHLPIYMSMIGLQYDTTRVAIPCDSVSTKVTDVRKWDIPTLRVAVPEPGGYPTPEYWYNETCRCIHDVVSKVMPANTQVTVIV